MGLNRILGCVFCMYFLFSCDKPMQTEKQFTIKNNLKEKGFKNITLDKDNVLFEEKIYQYPEELIIKSNIVIIKGHDTEKIIDIDKAEIQNECSQNFKCEIKDLVSWDFQKSDYVIPGFCDESDSLILSSNPRLYRGDEPKAWIIDSNTNTKFNIDTRYFNDIIGFIQLKKNRFLVLFDHGIQYGDDKYSFRYSIITLKG